MSNYTGKIELGNVVLTGQGTVNSAKTSISVTIPDYTEQPFTIVFETSGNTPLSSYTLNLGCGDDSEYQYRVRHLKVDNSETTFGEWSDAQEDTLTETGIGDNYNAIQIIGSGISYTALSLRRIHGKLISIIDNSGNEKEYSVVGNINSLFGADINKTGATEESVLISSYMSDESLSNFNGIYAMFEGDTKIKDAYYLYLPYTTIPERGSGELFSNADNLKRGPYRIGPLNMQIGQGSVGIDGCNSMFLNCANMVKGPKELRFGSLSRYAYSSMFQQCYSLLNGPEICATNFEGGDVMNMMFNECHSMSACTTVLPATTLAEGCYQYMFYGCTSLTTAPELPATTLANFCYAYMFQGCTSLTTAPEIKATTLRNSCFANMFRDCTSLTTTPSVLSATTLAEGCYQYMFYGCTSLTTAPRVPATTLASGGYCGMFEGCTSLTTAPKLPATTLANFCYAYMFQGCTSLTVAPYLPAETLTNQCYEGMFNGCSSLNWIAAMFTTRPGTAYTLNWVSGVASSGTFVKNAAATWSTSGASAIPYNWTVDYAVPIQLTLNKDTENEIISNVAWRTRNIGAEDVIDTGLYFAWGETQGYTAAQVRSGQKSFDWEEYDLGNGTARPSESDMKRYNSTDGKTVLEPSDDAAQAYLGGLWRMPTNEEYAALRDAVRAQWIENYQSSGINGLVCSANTDSSKVLFFPAAGYGIIGSVYHVGFRGDYWSGSLYSGDALGGRSLGFTSEEGVDWQNYYYRRDGFTVRAVIS